MSGTTVTFDYRAKCRLSPEWAADEIARLRKERDALLAQLQDHGPGKCARMLGRTVSAPVTLPDDE